MSSAAFPLKTVPMKRVLVDQKNVPFLLQGDAAWSLLVVQTKEEVELYFKNRSQKGFNTCLVNVLEHWFCNNPPFNAYGEAPFTSPENFSSPNDKYFLHVDCVINKAAEYNIQLLLAPMYLGSVGHDEGWINELLAQKLENCLEYG